MVDGKQTCGSPASCRNPTAEDLGRLHREFQDRLDSFREESGRYRDHSSGLVRSIADTLGGAGDVERACEDEIALADSYALKSRVAERQGNQREALRHIADAERYLDRARDSWRRYTGRSAQGAEDGAVHAGEAGAVAVAAVINPVLGLAAGLHVLGLEIYAWASGNGGEQGKESAPPVPRPATPPPIPRASPRADGPLECSLEVNETQGSADVERASCEPDKKDTIEEQILATVNASESFRRTRRDRKAVADAVWQQLATARAELEALQTPGDFTPRTREQLIAEARRELTEWAAGKDSGNAFGPFLIDAESPPNPSGTELTRYRRNRTRWERNADEYRRVSSGQHGPQGVVEVMGALYREHLTSSTEQYALLTDFLEGRGGNCEAQTKLILSAMEAARARPRPGETFAVQVFADHLQAVVVDGKNGLIWNLLTGEKTTTIRAPLYDPHLLYHAFLKGEGVAPPFPAERLLIPGVTLAKPLPGAPPGPTNSRFGFPASESYYSSAPPPAHATITSPYGPAYSDSDGRVPDFRGFGSGGGSGRWPSEGAYSLENFPFSGPKSRENVATQLDRLPFTTLYRGGAKEALIFRSDEQLAFYNALPTGDDKRNYLVHLAHQAMLEMFESADFQRGLALLTHPTSLREATPEQMRAAIEALGTFRGMPKSAAIAIAELHPLPGTEGQIDGDKKDAAEERFFIQGPLIHTYVQATEGFIDRATQYAPEFILLADRLSPEKRSLLFYLIRHEGFLRKRDNRRVGAYPIPEAMKKAIASKRLIGLRERDPAGYEPLIIDVTLVDSDSPVPNAPIDQAGPLQSRRVDEGKPARVESPGRKGKKRAGDDSARPEKARYAITARAMIDLVFEYGRDEGADGVDARWNPELSKAFLAINRKGEYDNPFLRRYDAFVKGYPSGQLSEDNPVREWLASLSLDDRREDFQKGAGLRFWMQLTRKKVPPDIARILRVIVDRMRKVKMASAGVFPPKTSTR